MATEVDFHFLTFDGASLEPRKHQQTSFLPTNATVITKNKIFLQ